jgi:diphthamide synthase subunit DPH2
VSVAFRGDDGVDSGNVRSGGKFHPLGLAMEHPEKTVLTVDPVNNSVHVADSPSSRPIRRLIRRSRSPPANL